MSFLVVWLSLTIITLETIPVDSGKVITCYYDAQDSNDRTNGKYTVDNIDASLCTHLVYAFATIENDKIVPVSTSLDLGNYKKFTDLKKNNLGLKTLLALGGWGDSKDGKYSRLAATLAGDTTKMNTFVNATRKYVEYHNFDGLDLDWEFPGYTDHGGNTNDKTNFVTLVKALRKEFNEKNLTLTAAVGATKVKADDGYNITELCDKDNGVHYVHLMTYDLHGSWDDKADHHSPLYKRGTEDGLNTDYTVNYWIDQGCSKSKLVVGVPLYGKSFTLTSSSHHNVHDNTTGDGGKGLITDEAGLLSYLEICKKIKNKMLTKVNSTKEIGPYAYHGKQWVGYDDATMAGKKAQYVVDNDLAGVLVWSISYADFEGTCGHGKYPLLNAMKKKLK